MLLTGKAWNVEFRARLQELKDAIGRQAAAEMDEAVAEIAALTDACRHYLAASFDGEAKRACAVWHYSWLLRRLKLPELGRMLEWHQDIWSLEIDGVRYSATLYGESFVAREGGLTLEMFSGDVSLCLLTFSVVPGALVGAPEPEAILVSRLQGRPNLFDEIRRATKALSEVSPRAALFSALAGLAKASGIRYVAGVCGANTINFREDKLEELERQYDAFFQTLEATGPVGGFFSIDLQAEPKPVNSVKAGHRIRTRRKRLLKAQIAETVATAWSERYLSAEKPAGG